MILKKLTNNNMYHKIWSTSIIHEIRQLPTIKEQPITHDIMEVRKKLGEGLIICKLLMQKTGNIDRAVTLYNDICMKLSKGIK